MSPAPPPKTPAVSAGGKPVRTKAQDLRKRASRRLREEAIRLGLLASALVSVLVSVGIVYVLLAEALPFFGEVSPVEFLTGTRWTPLLEPRSFGVLPLIGGTLLVAVIAALLAVPIGSLAVCIAEGQVFLV